jgi:hypothetical protein
MDELPQHLKKLSQVRRKDKLGDVVTADRINALQGAVKCLARGDAIRPSGGLTKKSETNSAILRGPGKTDEFVPQLEPFEVRVLGLPASYLTSYSPGHYVTCNLGYVTNLVDGERYRPNPVTFNGSTQAYDDINGSIDMGWFKGTSLVAGGSDVHVWLGYVTDVNGLMVISPSYSSGPFPSISFTDSADPPIPIGSHAGSGYSSDRFRFIHIAKVSYSTTQGWVVTQYRKGNLLIDYEIATPAGPPPWLNPWQCYISSSIEGTSVTLKVNPISTLMQTYSARVDVGTNRWTSKQTVSNFPDNAGNGFVLSDPTHIVYMECSFDSSWKLSSAEVKSGAPWTDGLGKFYNPQNMYVGHGTPASQKWYQLLAWLKPWVDGDPKDVKLGSTWYRLMCPTTTHLVEGFIEGARLVGSTDEQWVGLLPWYGCWSPGGS